ncbi:MAG: PQQ-dependent sugar dehydrogenase [Ardenticatenaceae bacterium]|nr:PQQ-dependent sugar dehydrogenase [Anaerolineales bacterium]MCB8938411.1 PQQ-dependent sugar dehydrogenase [Ardenticatenaceae bacterium]MCB8975279.1 PQQ-dependent sugar dehydrogenase [Ardenticatenaceae bacterium]
MKKQLYWILIAGFLLAVGLVSQTAVSAQKPLLPNGVGITAVPIQTGLNLPVDIANAGDDRLFIVEQHGTIRIIAADGNLLPTPFLDISALVDTGHPEQGLLGLVFHPNYPSIPYFYINYTDINGDTVIARYAISSNPNVANASSATEILRLDQPNDNHNAGDLNFGPQDGYLYIAMGDGGNGDDSGTGHNPEIGNAQDMTQLLGKVLRIDVDGSSGLAPDCGTVSGGSPPYTIPNNNPFIASGDGICNEIWASGLRNPWRASFDRETFDYYIADVGQGKWEEVNFQPASSAGGENYGWRCYEGELFTNLDTADECPGPYVTPFDVYPHGSGSDAGFSITGGFVYRGNDFPALQGIYIYADYVSENFWLAQNSGVWNITPLGPIGVSDPTSFGEGCDGELYVASHAGTIYQIQASGTAKPDGAALDQFVYLPLIFRGNSPGLTCSG